MFLFYTTYMTYLLQSSLAEENYGFTRWVNPRPIYLHAEYIYYLQDRIFDLEREVSSGYKEDEEDDNNNGVGSQETLCNDPYCICPNHKNNGRLLWRWCNTICYVATLLGRTYLIHMRHSCVCCLLQLPNAC